MGKLWPWDGSALSYYSFSKDNNSTDYFFANTKFNPVKIKPKTLNYKLMELPKYFIVKRDASNPLWKKYIDWLNKTYGSDWTGNTLEYYYGYDGSRGYGGTDVWPDISRFKNNPTILTLEQWDEIVNGFKLPEIWAIKQSISEEACEWFSKFKATRSAKIEGSYEYMVYFSNQNRTEFFNELPENCVEITIEQFKKYVLKQDNMKKYTIEELRTNEKLLVYIETAEQFRKIVNHCGQFVSGFYGKCCYNIAKRSYSSSSTKTDVGSYYTDSIIVTFDQIDFKDKIIAYKTIKRMPGLPVGTKFTNDGGGWVSEDGEWSFNDDVINDTEFFEPVYETIPIIDIRGYVAKFDFKERTVSFGCQTYTEQFVNNLVDFNKNSGLRIDEFDKIKQVFEVFKNN